MSCSDSERSIRFGRGKQNGRKMRKKKTKYNDEIEAATHRSGLIFSQFTSPGFETTTTKRESSERSHKFFVAASFLSLLSVALALSLLPVQNNNVLLNVYYSTNCILLMIVDCSSGGAMAAALHKYLCL